MMWMALEVHNEFLPNIEFLCFSFFSVFFLQMVRFHKGLKMRETSFCDSPVLLEYSPKVQGMQSKQQKGSPLRESFRVPGGQVLLHTDTGTCKITLLNDISFVTKMAYEVKILFQFCKTGTLLRQ